jgi:hypothetical protein
MIKLQPVRAPDRGARSNSPSTPAESNRGENFGKKEKSLAREEVRQALDPD